MTTYIVTASNAKEKTRIAEHGSEWVFSKLPHCVQSTETLLESCKTGYVRWWNNHQIIERNSP